MISGASLLRLAASRRRGDRCAGGTADPALRGRRFPHLKIDASGLAGIQQSARGPVPFLGRSIRLRLQEFGTTAFDTRRY